MTSSSLAPSVATEQDAANWGDNASGYILSRIEAENLVMSYARDRGLPAVRASWIAASSATLA